MSINSIIRSFINEMVERGKSKRKWSYTFPITRQSTPIVTFSVCTTTLLHRILHLNFILSPFDGEQCQPAEVEKREPRKHLLLLYSFWRAYLVLLKPASLYDVTFSLVLVLLLLYCFSATLSSQRSHYTYTHTHIYWSRCFAFATSTSQCCTSRTASMGSTSTVSVAFVIRSFGMHF